MEQEFVRWSLLFLSFVFVYLVLFSENTATLENFYKSIPFEFKIRACHRFKNENETKYLFRIQFGLTHYIFTIRKCYGGLTYKYYTNPSHNVFNVIKYDKLPMEMKEIMDAISNHYELLYKLNNI